MYEGEFDNGIANSYGRLILNHHNYFIGSFENGKPISPGTYIKSNGLESQHPD